MAFADVVDIAPPPGLTLPIAHAETPPAFACVPAHPLSAQTTSFITWSRRMDNDTHEHVMEGLAAAAVLAQNVEKHFQQDKHLDAVAWNTKGFVFILREMLDAVENMECVGKFE